MKRRQDRLSICLVDGLIAALFGVASGLLQLLVSPLGSPYMAVAVYALVLYYVRAATRILQKRDDDAKQ